MGLVLLAKFYQLDHAIFERCDDSSGHVSNVFHCSAQILFADYAARSTDKNKVADLMLDLCQDDDYGVRDSLIDCAKDCLPEPVIRTLIATLQKFVAQEENQYRKRQASSLIEALARQLKDAKLFEQTRIASWGAESTAAYIDIARVYLEQGEVGIAHSWLKKIPADDLSKSYERNQLLLDIYQQQGDQEQLAALLYQNFRLYRSTDRLHTLLDVIGQDKREEVITSELALIHDNPTLSLPDAEFLIAVERIDDVERYLLQRASQLDGTFYNNLQQIAKSMASNQRHLVASLIYRSLLGSILERGYTKAYPHGIRYLKKLDELAIAVNDWQSFIDHNRFKEQIVKQHGRKRSFWSKY